jgi:predicted lipase
MIALENVQSAVFGVALANKSPTSTNYAKYKDKLTEQLSSSGETIKGEPIPFYKADDLKKNTPAGYVIETNKQVMVCYHGTQFTKIFGSGGKEVQHDLEMQKADMKFGNSTHQVHTGFKKEYEASKASLYEALAKTDTTHKGVSISGHSLGGAVAQIAALDASTNKMTIPIKINEVITFGGPRVFSLEAAKKYHEVGLSSKSLRVKQGWDIVPRIPPKGMFEHVGHKVKLDAGGMGVHSGSVYRKMSTGKLTQDQIAKATPSKSMSEASVESYVDVVKKVTKQMYMSLSSVAVRVRNALTQSASSTSRTASNIAPNKAQHLEQGNSRF